MIALVLVTNHVLSGAAVGCAVRRPGAAFAAGVVSHFAVDAIPHYGRIAPERFLRVAVADGLTGLAALAAVGALCRPPLRAAALAGAAGAAVPDLDKPVRVFLGRELWPAAVNDVHSRIQRESPGRWPVEVLAAVGALTAIRLLGGRRAPGTAA